MGYQTYQGHIGDCKKCKRDVCKMTGKRQNGGSDRGHHYEEPVLEPVLLSPGVVLVAEDEAEAEPARRAQAKLVLMETDWADSEVVTPPAVLEEMSRLRRLAKQAKAAPGRRSTPTEPDDEGDGEDVLMPIF